MVPLNKRLIKSQYSKLELFTKHLLMIYSVNNWEHPLQINLHVVTNFKVYGLDLILYNQSYKYCQLLTQQILLSSHNARSYRYNHTNTEGIIPHTTTYILVVMGEGIYQCSPQITTGQVPH